MTREARKEEIRDWFNNVGPSETFDINDSRDISLLGEIIQEDVERYTFGLAPYWYSELLPRTERWYKDPKNLYMEGEE